MAEEKATILRVPDLPNVVKGDGRYLMTLLRDFLAQTAHEVNLANGFSAEDIQKADEGKIPAPRNFFLSFDRLGGVLTWSHVYDVENLAYYETRTNKQLGNVDGLLERTRDNKSTALPTSYVGHIYLFAVNKNGDSSTGVELHYSKARPTAPKDLALTKNQEGTLISFLEIPLDCMGANIYVNGTQHVSNDNLFLYTDPDIIKVVSVAYYDQFGEGERETLYCVLPDVTNFMVERNDSQLYFYWDAVEIHGVHYIVKVGVTPDWNKALQLFDTPNNKHRYIYPNTGEYYMLIKAVDEHGNMSENATYVFCTNKLDIHKNVIIELDQEQVAYNGVKNNMYYDAPAQELKLDKEGTHGEYIVDVELPQVYRARNWFEYKVIGETNSTILWDDMDWLWDSVEASNTMWNGTIGDLQGVTVTHEIARYTGKRAEGFIDIVGLNKTLESDSKVNPFEAQHADSYRDGRWHTGLYIGDTTRLAYKIAAPEVFTFSFNIAFKKGIKDTMLATIKGHSGYLVLGVDGDSNKMFLRGSDGITVWTTEELAIRERDWLTVAIAQDEQERRLFAHSMNYDIIFYGKEKATPIGAFSEIYLYPKL